MRAGVQWVMDVYALEDAGDEQPMFHLLRSHQPVFALPSSVRTHACVATEVLVHCGGHTLSSLPCWRCAIPLPSIHVTECRSKLNYCRAADFWVLWGAFVGYLGTATTVGDDDFDYMPRGTNGLSAIIFYIM